MDQVSPAGVIAASVKNVSCREELPPACTRPLLWAEPSGFTRHPGISPFQGISAGSSCFVFGPEVLGCRTLCLASQSSAGLGNHPYPRSRGHVWPAHLHGASCVSGYPTVVWGKCLGWGFALTPPILVHVLGLLVLIQALPLPDHSLLGCVVCVSWCRLCLDPASPSSGSWCVCFEACFVFTPPFRLGVSGGCVWVRLLPPARQSWPECGVFVFWCQFCLYPTIPG